MLHVEHGARTGNLRTHPLSQHRTEWNDCCLQEDEDHIRYSQLETFDADAYVRKIDPRGEVSQKVEIMKQVKGITKPKVVNP
mmetsp:Transcript_39919/g.62264  ORF Transcript_39919/g.62264 Transcript_39919/m.62264 type:complete len:82 (+) Transcript_39919:591-836(+)